MEIFGFPAVLLQVLSIGSLYELVLTPRLAKAAVKTRFSLSTGSILMRQNFA